MKNNAVPEIEANLVAAPNDPRWELAERIIHSAALSRAAQLRAILQYLVRQVILHPDEPIHEFEIAQRALGRRSDFNPLDDNIVRVQIAHLRKKLDHYFSAEGKDEPVVITIAMGSYVPVFSPRAASLQVTEESTAVRKDSGTEIEYHPALLESDVHGSGFSEQAQNAQHFPRQRVLATMAATLILALTGVCIYLWHQNQVLEHSVYAWHYEPAVNAFWSGFFDGHQNTDIVMSDSFLKLAEDLNKQTYSLDDYVQRSYIGHLLNEQKDPAVRDILIKVAGWRSSSSNHLDLTRRILALDPQGSKVRMYYSRDYTPELFKEDNVVLLGSRLTNPWDSLVDSHMNFTTIFDSNDITTFVNRAPKPGEQTSYTRTPTTGYCIVAYLPNPSSGNGKVLLIEGTSVEATEAGGDFLLSEEQLSNFQKMIHGKNFPYFEVLLKTSQVTGTPLTQTIAAYRLYPIAH